MANKKADPSTAAAGYLSPEELRALLLSIQAPAPRPPAIDPRTGLPMPPAPQGLFGALGALLSPDLSRSTAAGVVR